MLDCALRLNMITRFLLVAIFGLPINTTPTFYTEGWNIPRPDRAIQMPQAVAIPGRGDVEYIYEIVPAGFTEDKWVSLRVTQRGKAATKIFFSRGLRGISSTQLLSGKKKDSKYARLSPADRQAMVEILRNTKKDLPDCFKAS